MLLFLTAPGVIGEGEGRFSLVFLTLSILIATTENAPQRVSSNFRIALAPLFVFAGLAWALPASRSWSLVFVISAILCYTMLGRPDLSRRVLVAIACTVSIIAALYSWALVSGALDVQAGITLGVRSIFETFPWVYTQSGTRFSFVNEPRLLLGVGEPGQNVFLIAAGLVGASLIQNRIGRIVVLVLVSVAALYSQSQGVVMGLMGGGVAYLFISTLNRGKSARALFIAVVGLPLVGYMAYNALILRSSGSAVSTLSDRGLSSAGTSANPNQTAINILRALSYHPELGVLTTIALLLLIAASADRARSLFYVTCLTITALFSQPIWGAPAAWVLAALVASIEPERLARSSRALPESASVAGDSP